MARTSAIEFARQVRQEVAKITWPSRRETMVTTGMVLLMVFIAALFFFMADQGLSYLVRLLLTIGT
jgi:preprotein translocase subunit SecE